MSEQPRDPSPDRLSGVTPAELEEDWVPDASIDPFDPDRPPIRRSVDPDSPIMMVETAFLASAGSLIWLVNSFFSLGPILQVFFPIPIALIYLRWGNRAAWMGALISGLLLSVLIGPVRSIQFVMPYGFLGVLLGVLWYRRANWATSIGISMLLNAFGTFFRIWLLSVLTGENLWLYATTQMTSFLEWGLTSLGFLIQPSLSVVQAIVILLILVHSVVYLFVVHLIAWYLFDRLNNPISRPPHWVEVLLDND